MKDSVTSSCLHTELYNVLCHLPCSSLRDIALSLLMAWVNVYFISGLGKFISSKWLYWS
jgi:hypothetical protein